MKQLRMYAIGMLLLMTMLFATACGSTDKGNDNGNTGVTDENGTAADDAANGGTVNVDDVLFDTDGDGVYDHTDVDGDGLLEEIGRDTNDVVDDVVDDLTGNDTVDDGTVNDTVVEENGTTQENTAQ